MFIIISPSKTQSPSKNSFLEDKKLLYPKENKKVLAVLRKLSKKELALKLKVSTTLLNQTFSNIKNYNTLPTSHAFESFTGLVFFGLERDFYGEGEYQYIQKHLRILDAFYGLLEPGTLIKPYRLDFNTNIGLNLYNHWSIDEHFGKETVINLASKEFSKLLKEVNMITIHFMQNKNGKYVNQATYSKQARGKLLNYLIRNQIEDVSAIKRFNQDEYQYNPDLSDDNNIIFTR